MNLRYVSSGSLKTSRCDFNPESGQIKILLNIPDPRWQPEMMFDSWDSSSRTFSLVCPHNQKDNIHGSKVYPMIKVNFD